MLSAAVVFADEPGREAARIRVSAGLRKFTCKGLPTASRYSLKDPCCLLPEVIPAIDSSCCPLRLADPRLSALRYIRSRIPAFNALSNPCCSPSQCTQFGGRSSLAPFVPLPPSGCSLKDYCEQKFEEHIRSLEVVSVRKLNRRSQDSTSVATLRFNASAGLLFKCRCSDANTKAALYAGKCAKQHIGPPEEMNHAIHQLTKCEDVRAFATGHGQLCERASPHMHLAFTEPCALPGLEQWRCEQKLWLGKVKSLKDPCCTFFF